MPPLKLADVRAAMLKKLRSSLLTEALAKTLRLKPMTEPDAARFGVNPPWAGFLIPYWTPDGRPLKDMWRYRFWPQSRPSSLRYVQPKDSDPAVYFPPLIKGGSWAEFLNEVPPEEGDLCVTEGELKAAAGCVAGYPTLGLGGVFSWMSKKHDQAFLPVLEKIPWKNRRVNLVFDSDQSTKPQVQLALSRLATALVARGVRVHNILLPEAKGGAKQGLDDYLFAGGDLSAALNAAEPLPAAAELHALNTEVAVVWKTGNILRFAERDVVTPRQFTSILYRDRTYAEFRLKANGEKAAPRRVCAAEEWLGWPLRTTVSRLTYAPGAPLLTADKEYNLWIGPEIKPKKGDVGCWREFFERITRNLTPVERMWLLRWLAYPLRFPGTKMHSCVLIWSHRGGTGKNLLAEMMIPLYGEHNYSLINSRDLVSSFNGWAEAKQWIIGDEITLEDKRQLSGELKSRLTSSTIRINRKGVEAYDLPDYANFYLTSNDPVAVVLEPGERRTFVVHAAEEALPPGYGDRVKRTTDYAALLHYFVAELDFGDFTPKAEPPDTQAKLEMISESRSDLEAWAAAVKVDPASVSRNAFVVWTTPDLIKAFDPEDRRRISLRAMGMAMGRAGHTKALHNNGRLGNLRATFWCLDGRARPSTEAARIYQAERVHLRDPRFAKGRERIQ